MLQRFATTGLAMLVLAGSLMAQEEERPQRGDRGERGNRERGAFDFRGPDRNSYLGLLRMDVVKEELKITEAQQAEIDRIAEEVRNAPRGDFEFNRDASPEERAEQFAAMREAANQREEETRTKIAGVLDETQNARLLGIWVQRVGVDALSNETVAAKIGLTDDQKTQLAALRDEQRQAFAPRGERPQPAEGERPRGDGENPFARFAEQRREAEEKTMAVLTDDQKAQLAEIKGTAIEFPQPQFGNRERNREGTEGDRPRGNRERPEGDDAVNTDSDRPRRPASDE
jgi:hypothetical protein